MRDGDQLTTAWRPYDQIVVGDNTNAFVEEVGKAIIQLLNQGSVLRSRAGAKPD